MSLTLPVTTALAALMGLWYAILCTQVIRGRGTTKVSLGDGGNDLMMRRMRGQANFNEYVPLVLILFALSELQGMNATFLAVMAVIFGLGRLGHGYAFAFSDHFPPGRLGGTVATLLTLIVLSFANLWLVIA